MKAVFLCLIGIPALISGALAQARYDVKLEEAVKAVIAGKIGDLRPGFGPGDKPSMVLAEEQPSRTIDAWEIVGGGDPGFEQSLSGSFQTFSDGSTITPEQRRAWSKKTVSRVANF